MSRRQRALLVVVAGAAALALALWIPRAGRAAKAAELACAGCQIPWDTMIRFEIARSPEEVAAALAPADTPCGRCRRVFLDAENRVDLGFLVAYSGLNAAVVLFLAVPSLAAGRRGVRPLVRLGLAAAAVMLAGDAVETWQLFRLTRPDPGFGSALALLIPATRLKWLALAVGSLAIAGLYVLAHLRRRAWPLALLAVPYLAAGIAGLIAVASGDTGWYAQHTGWLARAWPASLLHAALWLVVSAFRRAPAGPPGEAAPAGSP